MFTFAGIRTEALEAIASFHAQRDLNPEILLSFRFLSNASPGRERPPTPLPGPSGIRLWCELRRGDLSITETTEALQGIRMLLQAAARPEAVSEKRWSKFQAFLNECSADALLGFIRAFEWGLHAGNFNEVQAQVRDKLAQSGRAAPGADAQRKHAHLFVHVLRAMTESGQKRLTAADLNQALTTEALAGVDAAILRHIEQVRELLLSRIDDVERAVRNIQPAVEEGLHMGREILQVSLKTQDSVRQLLGEGPRFATLQSVGIDLGPVLLALGMANQPTAYGALDPVDTDPPPLVSMASTRVETVKGLLERIGRNVWCALHGSNGTGKTQLVRLAVAPDVPHKCRWLRLRDLNPAQATRQILRVLDSIQSRRSAETYQEWLNSVCLTLGRGAVIVLDDLPNSDGHAPLDELLAHVCAACRNAAVRLLSMGRKPLAISTRSLVAEHLHEEAVPLFLDAEIRDVFLLYGAPAQFVSPSFLKLVKEVSRQHPVLVVEAARYLHADGWKWGDQALGSILLGSYAAGLEAGTVDNVRRSETIKLASCCIELN